MLQDWPVIIESLRFRKRHGHPKGAAWVVPDDRLLGQAVAQIALGQWAHLESILRTGSWAEPSVDYSVAGAIKTLTVETGSLDWKRSHRDGWLFQAISWIAAVETGRGPARPPHVGHAEKGFDGLQLLTTRDGSRVKRLILFEDKATKNPRKVIREDVWPAFKSLEAGERDAAIRSELSALLLQMPNLDEQQAVNRVMPTLANRVYRVAVTVDPDRATQAGIKRLFKGYPEVASGGHYRRRAHVLELTNLREWMASVAAHGIEYLEGLA